MVSACQEERLRNQLDHSLILDFYQENTFLLFKSPTPHRFVSAAQASEPTGHTSVTQWDKTPMGEQEGRFSMAHHLSSLSSRLLSFIALNTAAYLMVTRQQREGAGGTTYPSRVSGVLSQHPTSYGYTSSQPLGSPSRPEPMPGLIQT